jgi:hypothetical protein
VQHQLDHLTGIQQKPLLTIPCGGDVVQRRAALRDLESIVLAS